MKRLSNKTMHETKFDSTLLSCLFLRTIYFTHLHTTAPYDGKFSQLGHFRNHNLQPFFFTIKPGLIIVWFWLIKILYFNFMIFCCWGLWGWCFFNSKGHNLSNALFNPRIQDLARKRIASSSAKYVT